MISLQVGDCRLWSLIFQIQRYYLVVFVPQVYYTLIPPAMGFGGWNMCWPTVLRTHGIGSTVVFSHGIYPIRESIVTRMCMVLYCIGRETMRA